MSFKKATFVHCVSNAIENEAHNYGLDVNKSYIIKPAVDQEFFTPASRSQQNNCIKLVSTGSLVWVKGHEYLIEAFNKLFQKDIDAELHIIGEGEDYSRILFTCYDLGLENNVILHGKLSPDDVRGVLQTADIFVLSSLSEGISNAVLESVISLSPECLSAFASRRFYMLRHGLWVRRPGQRHGLALKTSTCSSMYLNFGEGRLSLDDEHSQLTGPARVGPATQGNRVIHVCNDACAVDGDLKGQRFARRDNQWAFEHKWFIAWPGPAVKDNPTAAGFPA